MNRLQLLLVISVIIPAYNARRWLPETLRSVAAQDGVEMEIVVVDDGSKDDTAEYVLREWPQVRLIRTENRGVSHARNTGTEAARGELIQYLDADDLLLPGKMRRHEELLRQHPEADVVYAAWQRLQEKVTGEFVPAEKVRHSIEDVHADPEIAFFSGFWCPTGAYMFRRQMVEKILPWKEWLPVVQDARFAWDAAAAGARWLRDPEISVLYRQHLSGSVSTRNRRAFQQDCLANMNDIRRHWEKEGTLAGDRKKCLLNSYEALAAVFYETDPKVFQEVHRSLLEVEPAWQPSSASLRVLSRFLGYENAQRVSCCWRRIKAVIG